jgi:hypothetical protein
MLRVDDKTGAIIWQFQPVPYALDDDPDWSAGRFPGVPIAGFFIARRVFPNPFDEAPAA